MANQIPSIKISGARIHYFFQGTLEIGEQYYMVAPITEAERIEAGDFLREECKIPFEAAASRVNDWIQRHLSSSPWSAYVIRDDRSRLIGLWSITPDQHPLILHVTLNLSNQYEKMGITRGIWHWTTTFFLPALHQRKVRISEPTPLGIVHYSITEAKLQVCLPLDDVQKIKKVQEVGFKEMSFDDKRAVFHLPLSQLLSRTPEKSDTGS